MRATDVLLVMFLAVLCSCGYAAEGLDKQTTRMLEQTVDALQSGNLIRWPKDLSELRFLSGAIQKRTCIMKVGDRYYRVEYSPPSLESGIMSEPSSLVLVLYRVRRNGSSPLVWRETYAVRADGVIVYGQGWSNGVLNSSLLTAILVAMIALPYLVWRGARKWFSGKVSCSGTID